MKWTVKFLCHLPKQHTGFKKNTQLFMKARLDNEDDEVWVREKTNFSTGKLFWKSEISAIWYAVFQVQDSSFLLHKNTVGTACRLSKTKLTVWQNVLIYCPNWGEDFSPLHGKDLLVSIGWGCSRPGFGGSSCVAGFALPQEPRGESSTRGSIRVANS